MCISILVLLCFGAASGSEAYYHSAVGIPLAAKMKALEDNIPSLDIRIIGGDDAQIHAHPYLAGLIGFFPNIKNVTVCGSSIVTPDRLVTAAHCWFDGEKQVAMFEVVMGTNQLFNGGIRVNTSKVVMNPGWNARMSRHDIAVIYMPNRIVFTESIQPIALPGSIDHYDWHTGQWMTAAGFGFTSDAQTSIPADAVLKEVKLRVIKLASCQAVYGNAARSSNICTAGSGGVGICQGDSGGPLVMIRNGKAVLLGVSQYVKKEGCALGYPSVFTRVTSFIDFIRSNL